MPDLIIKPASTSGNKVIIQDQAGGAVLTTADSGATFSGGNIGTVTAGNLSNSAIVMPRIKQNTYMYDSAETTATAENLDNLNISHSEYLTVTPEHTGDILTFGYFFISESGGYYGFGIERATATNFASPSTIWSSGRHAWGNLTTAELNYMPNGGTVTGTATEFGMSADTTYYCRMIGMTHSPNASYKWGVSTTNATRPGVYLNCQRWSIV